MNPKSPKHLEDERDLVFEQSRSTGIVNWQELGHMDFKDLIHFTRQKNALFEDLNTIINDD